LRSFIFYGNLTDCWTANSAEIKKPKWLLDEACIAELYAKFAATDQKHLHENARAKQSVSRDGMEV
jgi:hypothetical protein